MSDIVKAYQSALRTAGFDPGPIDGDYGKLTRAAVRAFQEARDLEVDGRIGPITREALGIKMGSVAPEVSGEDPPWLANARGYMGMREIVGPRDNPEIVDLWKKAQVPGVNDDETPWCAAFVSAVLEEVGIRSQRTGWARGYQKWGEALPGPAVGAIVVFSRGPNAGHVGIVLGRDQAGNLMVIGGNQGNAVSVAPFSPQRAPKGRVLGYRWPQGVDRQASSKLPLVNSNGRLSSDEA
jgi:uncharacterized protein (TIGR02594 family)